MDFTGTGLATYGTEARKNVDGTLVLWTADVFFDGVIKYSAPFNDRDAILMRIGGVTPTAKALGYSPEDVTLDGVVKHTGGEQRPGQDPDQHRGSGTYSCSDRTTVVIVIWLTQAMLWYSKLLYGDI